MYSLKPLASDVSKGIYLSSVRVVDEEVAELFELDDTVTVAVELVQQSGKVLALDAHLETNKECLKLIGTKNTVLVEIELVIHVAKNSLFVAISREVEKLATHRGDEELDLLSVN